MQSGRTLNQEINRIGGKIHSNNFGLVRSTTVSASVKKALVGGNVISARPISGEIQTLSATVRFDATTNPGGSATK